MSVSLFPCGFEMEKVEDKGGKKALILQSICCELGHVVVCLTGRPG